MPLFCDFILEKRKSSLDWSSYRDFRTRVSPVLGLEGQRNFSCCGERERGLVCLGNKVRSRGHQKPESVLFELVQ